MRNLPFSLPVLCPLVCHRCPLLVCYLWNETKSEVLEVEESMKCLGIAYASGVLGKAVRLPSDRSDGCASGTHVP